jgi:hypothetical protein
VVDVEAVVGEAVVGRWLLVVSELLM